MWMVIGWCHLVDVWGSSSTPTPSDGEFPWLGHTTPSGWSKKYHIIRHHTVPSFISWSRSYHASDKSKGDPCNNQMLILPVDAWPSSAEEEAWLGSCPVYKHLPSVSCDNRLTLHHMEYQELSSTSSLCTCIYSRAIC